MQNKGGSKMKKKYECPNFKIDYFETTDIITVSGDGPIELPDITFFNDENWCNY